MTTLTTALQRVLVFNLDGSLAEERDAQGHHITHSYGTNPALPSYRHRVAVTDQTSGRSLLFGYALVAGATRMYTVTDPLNQIVQYRYTSDGYLSTVTDTLDLTTTYEYSTTTPKRLTKIWNPGNSLGTPQVVNTYDATSGKVTQQVEATGRTVSYAYSWVPDAVSAYVTTMTIQSPGLANQVVKHHYRADGTPRFMEENGQFLGYQAAGPGHGLAVVLDGTLQPTRMATTALGQTTRITDTLGGVTRLGYTGGNYPTQIVGVDGLTTTLRYDAAHQVTQTLRLGSNGQSLAAQATYTAQNRIQTVTGADGVVTHYRYDGLGQTDRVVRGYGSTQPLTTTYAYDSLGRVTDVTQGADTALAVTTHTSYRADSQPLTITQNYVSPGTYSSLIPDQNVWTAYGYDSLGRQIWSQTGVDGRYHGYQRFDAAGRLLWTVENPVDGSGVPTLPTTMPTYSASQPDANLVTQYGYDGLGRTTLVTNTAILTGSFNIATKLWSGTTTRTTRTEYDQLSRPITTTHNYRPGEGTTLPDVNVQTVTHYDGAGNVIWQRDALGRWTHMEYDALSRPVTTTLNYENGNPATVDSGNWSWTDGTDSDIKTVTVYDSATQRVAKSIQNYQNGSFDLVATQPITDRISIPTYDGFGRVITTTMNVETTNAGISGTNLTQTTAFDSAIGRVIGSRDALGIWSSPQYDALGRTITQIQNCVDGGVAGPLSCDAWSSTYPDRNLAGAATSFDALWRPSSTTDALGRVTRTTYDDLGRVVSTVQNYQSGQAASATVNVTTSTTYNGLGQVVSSTDAVGAITNHTYNGLGQMVSSTDAVTRTRTLGERWQATPDGRVSVTQIDGLGRTVATITNYHNGTVSGADNDDRDLIERTVYDRGGNVVKTIGSMGRVTAFAYDHQDRLIQVTENQLTSGCSNGAPDCNIVTRYRYDRAGNRVALIDANVHTRRFQYDAADRQVAATDALTRTTSWTYSLRGEQLTRTDARGTVTTSYDALGRSSLLSGTDPTLPITQTWTYDQLGRLSAWKDLSTPAGTTGVLSYTYDALNRTTSILDPRTGTVAATYTARGERASLIYPNSSVVSSTYTLAGELDTVKQGSLTLGDYRYDSSGRVDRLVRNAGTITTTWTYDKADRITNLHTSSAGSSADFLYKVERNREGQREYSETDIDGTLATLTYGYDGLGRLTSADTEEGLTLHAYSSTYDAVGNRLSATVDGTTTTRAYDAANQVSGWTYDAAGNLVADDATTLSYDLLNRLTFVDGAAGKMSYGYHGEELIQTNPSASVTKVVQDRMGGLSQVLATVQGGTTTSYAYGRERLSTLSGSTRTWDVVDALGSVSATLDNAGNPLTSQRYDPWGQPIGTDQPAPFGFTGEYQDTTSGLVYLRARWYRPSEGTLLGRDPFEGTAEMPYSQHYYQYGLSDPILNTDPTGRRVTCDDDDYCEDSMSIWRELVAAYEKSNGRLEDWNALIDFFDAHPEFARSLELHNAGPVTAALEEVYPYATAELVNSIICRDITTALSHWMIRDAKTDEQRTKAYGLLNGGATQAFIDDGGSIGGIGGRLGSVGKRTLPTSKSKVLDPLDDLAEELEQCSFSADTPVTTPDGQQAISILAVGDQVLAYNEATATTESYTVTAVMAHDDPLIVVLDLDGERIETTPEHPFFTAEQGWVVAGELSTELHIRKADGTYGPVQDVVLEQRTQTMYNLTVAIAHTFFVGDGQWLVHNQCGYLPDETVQEIQTVVDEVGETLYVVGGATRRPDFGDIDYAADVGGPWEAYTKLWHEGRLPRRNPDPNVQLAPGKSPHPPFPLGAQPYPSYLDPYQASIEFRPYQIPIFKPARR